MWILLIVLLVAVVAAAAFKFVGPGSRGAGPTPPRSQGPPGTGEEVDGDTLVATPEAEGAPTEAPPKAPERPSFAQRLGRARSAMAGYVGSVLSRSGIDEETWDELEEALIRADVGVHLAQDLLVSVRATVREQGLTEPAELIEALKDEGVQKG